VDRGPFGGPAKQAHATPRTATTFPPRKRRSRVRVVSNHKREQQAGPADLSVWSDCLAGEPLFCGVWSEDEISSVAVGCGEARLAHGLEIACARKREGRLAKEPPLRG
jgi:hypothetical protein